jgi:hypothetical protein
MKKLPGLLLIITVIIACNNKRSGYQPVSRFDSISLRVMKEHPDISDRELERKILEELLADQPGAFQTIQKGEQAIDQFSSYVDTLTVAFALYTGSETPGVVNKEKESDSTLTNEFFIEHGNAERLRERLSATVAILKDVVRKDSSHLYLEQLLLLPPRIEGKPYYEDFARAYFLHLTPIKALQRLQQFEKDIADMRAIIFREYTNAVSSQP